MAVDLPLFPLGAVLFPHMPMRLRIFEPRYVAMMRDCQESNSSFGVVGIRAGRETAGPAQPFEVGTLARFRTVDRRDDGGYDLVIVGASRFRITRLQFSRPYLRGTVEYLADAHGDATRLRDLGHQVSQAFLQYARSLGSEATDAAVSVELPEEPELLSYLVASALQVDTTPKQKLLELDSAEARLRGCLTLLRREAAFFDQSLARTSGLPTSVSAN